MKRAEHQPLTISVTIFGGIYYKLYSVPEAFTVMPQHAHDYDHITALLQGDVVVNFGDNTALSFSAPATIRVRARRKHNFVTLTPNVVLACIHNADRLGDGEPAIHQHHNLELEE
jgi:hypothetical protein